MALMISSVVLSSAQPNAQSQCIEAYTNFVTTACKNAYSSLRFGNASDDQVTMVCNLGESCNIMLEDTISACNSTQSNMVSLVDITMLFNNLLGCYTISSLMYGRN